MIKPLPSQERLHEIFYCVNGVLYWKKKSSPFSKVMIGDVAGSVNNRGYGQIIIDGKTYSQHRIVWVWFYGKEPENTIEHSDNNKMNNNIWNLYDWTLKRNLQGKLITKSRGESVRDENGKRKRTYTRIYENNLIDRIGKEEFNRRRNERSRLSYQNKK